MPQRCIYSAVDKEIAERPYRLVLCYAACIQLATRFRLNGGSSYFFLNQTVRALHKAWKQTDIITPSNGQNRRVVFRE